MTKTRHKHTRPPEHPQREGVWTSLGKDVHRAETPVSCNWCLYSSLFILTLSSWKCQKTRRGFIRVRTDLVVDDRYRQAEGEGGCTFTTRGSAEGGPCPVTYDDGLLEAEDGELLTKISLALLFSFVPHILVHGSSLLLKSSALRSSRCSSVLW